MLHYWFVYCYAMFIVLQKLTEEKSIFRASVLLGTWERLKARVLYTRRGKVAIHWMRLGEVASALSFFSDSARRRRKALLSCFIEEILVCMCISGEWSGGGCNPILLRSFCTAASYSSTSTCVHCITLLDSYLRWLTPAALCAVPLPCLLIFTKSLYTTRRAVTATYICNHRRDHHHQHHETQPSGISF